MAPQPRRTSTLKERKTPCQCCGFPLSHRHHVLPVRVYGETEWTLQLCPNCHTLYHLIESAWRGNRESQELLQPFMRSDEWREKLYWPLTDLYQKAKRVHEATEETSQRFAADWERTQARMEAGESWSTMQKEYQIDVNKLLADESD